MTKRPNAVTMRGKPLTLVGPELQVGQPAPDAVVVANDMSEVKLSSYRGRTVILSAVPSLDTPVCSMETRRFNQEAGKLGGDVIVLTLSMDLPFAQKRWCGAEGVDKVVTLSDYRYGQFGTNYGVLIDELRLLARTIFVLDPAGKVRYIQPVKEITQEPDYAAVLSAVKEVAAPAPAR